MEKAKKFVEGHLFQNFILAVIVLNAAIMGILTARHLPAGIRQVLTILDTACLWIFIAELLIKFVVYRLQFFRSGWNLFDLAVVILSLFSEFSFFSVFRIFRIFRVLRSLKALKSLRAFRMVSSLKNLRIIVDAIGSSIPGICWSGMLLLLVYYIFSIMGTTLFGSQFPDWFGSIGKSFYTLFQVMTLESWSMGISRPVMEVFSWAWLYFVPFVLCTSFLIMNVVVGIVVNAISEVSESQAGEERETPEEDIQAQLRRELASLRKQLAHVENLLDQQEIEKK
ncbi:MAG: ion transporter [Acetatifactor sp.]